MINMYFFYYLDPEAEVKAKALKELEEAYNRLVNAVESIVDEFIDKLIDIWNTIIDLVKSVFDHLDRIISKQYIKKSYKLNKKHIFLKYCRFMC